MAATAIASVPMGAWNTVERRRAEFDRLAYDHLHRVVGLGVGMGGPSGYGLLSWGPGGRQLTPEERRRDERHFDLFLKYRRASRRPWLPVAPDPPGPG